MDKSRLLELLPKLAGKTVLVVGDLFLDEYVVGKATRLSREAPVPVLEHQRTLRLPGGACNPANNIAALEGEALQVGVVGGDQAGRELIKLLVDSGIGVEGVVVDAARPTTTKTRIVAQGSLRFPQQLARIDRVDRQPIAGTVQSELLAWLGKLVSRCDAVLVSDYKAGVVNQEVTAECLRLSRDRGVLATVDSQGDLGRFKGYDLVRCNAQEAEAHLRTDLSREDGFTRATARLLAELDARAVLVTRGSEGMSLVARDQGYVHIPAANRSEVYDVTGAGDTVIAVTTLALAAGASFLEAAHLANHAAGLVVRKLGNATATPEELAQAIRLS